MRLFPLLNSMIVSYISKGHMKLKLITFIRLSVYCVRSDMLLYSVLYILPHLRGWYKMSLYVYIVCMLHMATTTTRPLTKKLHFVRTPYSSIVFYKHIEHITKL